MSLYCGLMRSPFLLISALESKLISLKERSDLLYYCLANYLRFDYAVTRLLGGYCDEYDLSLSLRRRSRAPLLFFDKFDLVRARTLRSAAELLMLLGFAY